MFGLDIRAKNPMKESLPEASVVIPAYNAAGLVGDAIESALGQTWPRVEVIVIDDGSSDDTVDVLRRYGDQIRWETGPNRGACSARNRGAELARGEFVQFLDADDVLLPDKLARQVPHATAQPPRTLSFTLGREQIAGTFLDRQYRRLLPPAAEPIAFALSGVIQTSAPLHRRTDLLEVGGFDEALPAAQEYDLHLRLLCSGWCLAQLPEVLFEVRRRPGSISSDPLRVLAQMDGILGRALQLLESCGQASPERRHAIALKLARSAQDLELGGRETEARAAWCRARAIWPQAPVQMWTPRWRPLVRVLGPVRTGRLRNWLRRLLAIRSAERG